MRTIFLAALALSSLALAKPVNETRKLPDFKKIDASGGVELDVAKGAPQVVLDTDDETLARYEVAVSGDTLVIKRKSGIHFGGHERFVVHATMAQLDALDASGGVRVTLGDVPTPALKLDLSGGVTLEARQLKTSALDFDGSGGVTAKLAGAATKARVEASGGVDFKASELTVETLAVDASGGCQLDVKATQALSGDISGGVGLKVHGHAPKGRVQTSGGAGVTYVD